MSANQRNFFVLSYNDMGLNYTTAVPNAGKAQIESHLSIHIRIVRCGKQLGAFARQAGM